MAKVKKKVSAPEEDIAAVEDKLRDLINWVEVQNTEDEISDELTKELTEKLRDIAEKLGLSFD